MRVPYLSFLALFGLYVVATAPSHSGAKAHAAAASQGDHLAASGTKLVRDATEFCSLPAKARHARHADTRQRVENYLQDKVCSGRMPIHDAGAMLAGNWLATYRRYLGGAE